MPLIPRHAPPGNLSSSRPVAPCIPGTVPTYLASQTSLTNQQCPRIGRILPPFWMLFRCAIVPILLDLINLVWNEKHKRLQTTKHRVQIGIIITKQTGNSTKNVNSCRHEQLLTTLHHTDKNDQTKPITVPLHSRFLKSAKDLNLSRPLRNVTLKSMRCLCSLLGWQQRPKKVSTARLSD